MIKRGQVWTSGGRTVRVLDTHDARVTVRDTYGWRRQLTEGELERGFDRVTRDQRVENVRGVMARRALADLEPA